MTIDPFGKANTFLVKENLQLPIFQLVSNPTVELESSTIPVTYLINQQKNVVVAKIGPADWNSDSFRSKSDEY